MIGVLNTRPRDQAAELSRLLTQAGYRPYEIPLVELALLPDGVASISIRARNDIDGILLSSPNLLPLLSAHLDENLRQTLIAKPWYLIGHRSREQVERFGAQVAFVPHVASLQGFLAEFPVGKKIRLLHLCSEKTRLDVKDFSEKGIQVVNLAVYRPQCPPEAARDLEKHWPHLAAVLFASGSAAHNLFRAAPLLGKTLGTPEGPNPISIGPSSTDALNACGVTNIRVAPTADNAGFLAALKKTSTPPDRTPELP